jgi:hypothetical protein
LDSTTLPLYSAKSTREQLQIASNFATLSRRDSSTPAHHWTGNAFPAEKGENFS